VHAGSRTGEKLDVVTALQGLLDEEACAPEMIADALLDMALKIDHGRPVDDISIVVLRVANFEADLVRRMSVRLPIGP